MFIKKGREKTKEPDSVEHGYSYAVFILGLKLRTEGEVREKMKQRGYRGVVIDEVVTRLIDQKYIDDDRYGRVMVTNLKTYKTLGYFGVKKKLLEKRLPDLLITHILNEEFTIIDEYKVAIRYVEKEGLVVDDSLEYEDRQKLAVKLNRRGFRSEVVSKIFSGQVPEVE